MPVYEVGEADGQPIFTMKLLGGSGTAEGGAFRRARNCDEVLPCNTRMSAGTDREKPGNVRSTSPVSRCLDSAQTADVESGLTVSTASWHAAIHVTE